MSEQIFLRWLQRFLSDKGHPPVSFEGLSSAEVNIAKQVEKEFREADTLKKYSNIFLNTLDSSEHFSQVAIGALSAFIKIGHLGETVRDINVFGREMAEIFTRELGLEYCSILMKHPDTGKLRLAGGSAAVYKYLSAGKRRKYKAPTGDGLKNIARHVVGSGDYIFIPDVTVDERCSHTVDASLGITALLSSPVKSGSGILGVVNCGHSSPNVFDKNKINLILLLSNFAGQVMTLITLQNMMSEWKETLKAEVQNKTAELRSKNAKLHKLAITDALTNLYNRRFFFTRLEEEFSRMLRYNEQFALLVIDLDNLKYINDTYGHVGGDKVIRHISRFMKKSVRRGDVIGRIGGDEFGYIMLDADEEIASHFSVRLQESLARETFRGIKNKPTLSIGIAAVANHKFKKYEDIYKAADDALYEAKNKKDSICIFGKTSRRKR